MGAVLFDPEEFWEDLLAFIEEGRVIPVVGKALLTIEEDGKQVSLYRVVAERLLSKYGLSAAALPDGEVLREHHELNDAVCALARAGKRIKDLYRPVNDILGKVLVEHPTRYRAPRVSWPRSGTSICSSPLRQTTCWREPSMLCASMVSGRPTRSSTRPSYQPTGVVTSLR